MSIDTKEDLLQARFHLNMKRIAGLTELIFRGGGNPAETSAAVGSEEVRADLFRAIVVFLHATFEDVLRTAARQRLGEAAPEFLEKIPLVGNTKDKFSLGSLAAHRGKTVDDVIRESVEKYLNRESFGASRDVDEILRHMGLDTKPFKCLYADLDRMMKRRHRIVHETDLPIPRDHSLPSWTLADNFQLALWNLTVLAFYALLRVSLDPTDELQRWYFERRMKAIDLFRLSSNEITVPPGPHGDRESVLVAFRKKVDEVMQEVVAQLGPPSHEELRALAERIVANQTA